MKWTSIKERLPMNDGNYLTYIKTNRYDSIGFTQFIDGEFMSSFVTHWSGVRKPQETPDHASLIFNAIGEGYGFNGTKDNAVNIINNILDDEI